MNQAELARRSGVSPRQLCRYETARTLPTRFDELVRLAVALEVDLPTLIAPQLLAELVRTAAARRGALGLASSA